MKHATQKTQNDKTRYAPIPFSVITDGDLSLSALGLLTVLLSLPPDWSYSVKGLVKLRKEKEGAIRSLLKELRLAGYLKIDKIMPNQTSSKKIEYRYTVYAEPQLSAEQIAKQDIAEQDIAEQGVDEQDVDEQGVGKQGVGEQDFAEQDVVNPTQSNIKESNIKKSIIKESIIKESMVKDSGTEGGEREGGAEASGTGQIAILLVLNDRSEFAVTQEQVSEWRGLYPAVDVMQELRSMKGWLSANPERRKTRSGIVRFINGWLSRTQNRSGSAPLASGSAYGVPEVGARHAYGEPDYTDVERYRDISM